MDEFDFVIVGAGTAGCCLAYRLGEKGYKVCVLEAGPPDRNPLIRIPSGIMKTSHDKKITWRYEMQGNENTKNRMLPTYYGKTLGGSSAINGMCYNRGQRSDFDNWASEGNPGWDFDSVLPYFKKSEQYYTGGSDYYRGRSGPVPVGLLQRRDKLTDRFIEGCTQSGIDITEDYNGQKQDGVSYIQAQIYKGQRWGSAHAYLRPARRKFGTDVRTNALVRRVVIEDGRATAVDYSPGWGRETRRITARQSVIVSAGATMSPKLLQLSGVGPSKLLNDFGIEVKRDMQGVGQNLSDHYSVRLVAGVKSGHGTINEVARGLPAVREALAWLVGKPSVVAQSSMSAFTFCKRDPDAQETDYSLMFLPASLKGGMTRKLDDYPGVTGGAWQQRPESRGYVQIQSKEMEEPPLIYPNFLDTELDCQVLVDAMKHLRKIFDSPAMKEVVTGVTLPVSECNTDEEWLDYIRGNGMTSYHNAGTCKMGPSSDSMAVVDERLRVHGIDGLRVIDGSVMPTQPSGNTNGAVMMIAEKAAAMILEDVSA